MKNSAFAVNPCPRDLLGKQWLFMHMSAHYRKMWSAQSVVDSAAPASLKAKTATPRSASKPSRLSQKPSRADTDPGPGVHPRARGGARDGLDARASSASASRRQLEYGGSVLRKPASLARHRRRDQEPSTYYNKLNQLVPDQRSALRTSGQFLSEVFTPRVPHRPQVLRTEVPSRLRYSSTYCPPRTKPVHSKPGVQGQEIGADAARPIWTSSSPPVSSRDSAYNGGISSGGESRGPTPDQAGTKKHSKKSEKKGKKKADPKRPYSADTKIRRKTENKFMKKLLEDERNELHEQRLRVDPWHGINQDDRGDEILRNIDNLHIESHVDDSLTEHEGPANTGSLSDDSIEEDMAEEEEVDEAVEIDSTKGADAEDSVIKDESVAGSEESVPSQSLSKSSSKSTRQQIATQTDPPIQTNISKEFKSSRSQQSPSPTISVSTSTKQSCSSHSTQMSSSHPSNTSSSTEKKAEMETSRLQNEVQKKSGSASHCDTEESSTKHDDMLENKNCSVNNRINDMSYARFLNMITKDVLEKRVVSYKALKAICDEHIEANCDKLDKERMQQEVDKLQIQLEISRDDHIDSVNNVADNPKREKMPFTSEFIPSLVEVDKFSILSGPNEVQQNLLTKPPIAEDISYRSTRLQATKMFGGALDSQKKPIVLIDEESLYQHGNLKVDRLHEKILLRTLTGEDLRKTLSPPIMKPVESVPVSNEALHTALQNAQPLHVPPQQNASQFSKGNCSIENDRLSDVVESYIHSKKSSTSVVPTEGSQSFKLLASSLLPKYQYLNYLSIPAKESPATLRETKEEKIADSTGSVAPTSDQFESYYRSWLENNKTMPSIRAKFTEMTSGHLDDTSDKRADLNIEIENSIKEIEKELEQTGVCREEVNIPEITNQEESQVVELFFRHGMDGREKNIFDSRVINTSSNNYISGVEDKQSGSVEENVHCQSVKMDEVQDVLLETKQSSNMAQDNSNADGGKPNLSPLSTTEFYPLTTDSSSIPLGTGQNSDILRLKLTL